MGEQRIRFLMVDDDEEPLAHITVFKAPARGELAYSVSLTFEEDDGEHTYTKDEIQMVIQGLESQADYLRQRIALEDDIAEFDLS